MEAKLMGVGGRERGRLGEGVGPDEKEPPRGFRAGRVGVTPATVAVAVAFVAVFAWIWSSSSPSPSSTAGSRR